MGQSVCTPSLITGKALMGQEGMRDMARMFIIAHIDLEKAKVMTTGGTRELKMTPEPVKGIVYFGLDEGHCVLWPR